MKGHKYRVIDGIAHEIRNGTPVMLLKGPGGQIVADVALVAGLKVLESGAAVLAAAVEHVRYKERTRDGCKPCTLEMLRKAYVEGECARGAVTPEAAGAKFDAQCEQPVKAEAPKPKVIVAPSVAPPAAPKV